MAVMEHVYSPLWGCAGDWVEMVVKCIVGLFWGRIFNRAANLSPKQSHNALDHHLDPVSLATSKWWIWWCLLKETFDVMCIWSVSRDWLQIFFYQGFQRLRSSSPPPLPVAVNLGDPVHDGGEVVHNDSQAMVEHGDDIHEEVLQSSFSNQVVCDVTAGAWGKKF